MFIHISITEIFNRALLNILVLVLTGNPGVGKHTVSKKLAEILGYEIVDVNKEAVKVGTAKQNDSIDVDVEKTKKILKEKISDSKKNDNLGSEILGVIAYDSIEKFGEEKTFQINTTSLTVEGITKKIEDVINGTSKGDAVDWLADITKKNDLRKFFPD